MSTSTDKWINKMYSRTVEYYSAIKKDSLSMGFSRQEYWSGLPFPSPSLAQLKPFSVVLPEEGKQKMLIFYVEYDKMSDSDPSC